MTNDLRQNPQGSLSLEGRLLAHRKLLALLIGRLSAQDQRDILAWLDDRSVFQDGQEDPGAVPGTGLALEYALADELRQLANLIDRQRSDGDVN